MTQLVSTSTEPNYPILDCLLKTVTGLQNFGQDPTFAGTKSSSGNSDGNGDFFMRRHQTMLH